MRLLIDFIPIVAFFIVFKVFGIYAATAAGIIITALQLLISSIVKKHLDNQQLVTLIVFVIFGGLTLYFHNPIFVKWKPTIIYWIFGMVLFFSHFIGSKTIMHRMLENMFLQNNNSLPVSIWKKLNMAWAIFFIALGFLNLYVAYHYSTEAWVNFKLYGTLGLVLAFSIAQSFYLSKYISEVK